MVTTATSAHFVCAVPVNDPPTYSKGTSHRQYGIFAEPDRNVRIAGNTSRTRSFAEPRWVHWRFVAVRRFPVSRSTCNPQGHPLDWHVPRRPLLSRCDRHSCFVFPENDHLPPTYLPPLLYRAKMRFALN
jgi:hypothetical protein